MEARVHTCWPGSTPPSSRGSFPWLFSIQNPLTPPDVLITAWAWSLGCRGHCGSPVVLEGLGPDSLTQNSGRRWSLGSLVEGGEKLSERAQPAELAL